MSDNTKIWDALARTDPKHTKPFKRAGGFSGTSVKPIYLSLKMTEQFGACGIGWGMGEPSFQVVPCGQEVAVYCTVGLWHGAKDNLVYGVGGDHVAKTNKHGLFIDDEAFKKAYTDALGNAMKQLGMSADVHMGQHDDDKYVTELRREFDAPKKDQGQWHGPLGISELKKAMKAFAGDLHACQDAEQLNGLMVTTRAVLEQCERDLPDWYFGDGGDIKGVQHAIMTKTEQLNKKAA